MQPFFLICYSTKGLQLIICEDIRYVWKTAVMTMSWSLCDVFWLAALSVVGYAAGMTF